MTYTTPEQFFSEVKMMRRRGTALLAVAGAVVLGLAALILELPRLAGAGLTPYLLVVDYLAIPAVAGPGLILYLLRVRSFRLAKKGRVVTFSTRTKAGLIFANWIGVALVFVASQLI